MSTEYKEYCTINTVLEYVNAVNLVREEYLCIEDDVSMFFRGQNDDYELLPSVLRNINGKEYNERLIINYFKSLYKNYTSERFTTKPELFAFMQHYGIPTRLIDWTENSLMAPRVQ